MQIEARKRSSVAKTTRSYFTVIVFSGNYCETCSALKEASDNGAEV
jgi:hypothetical protein